MEDLKTMRVELQFYLDIQYMKLQDVRDTLDDVITRTLFEFNYLNPVLEPHKWRIITENKETDYIPYYYEEE